MKKTIISALLFLLLQGCSTSLAYNHLDWLAQWYLADYVDLNSDQDEKLQDSLTDILGWHRQVELVVYQQQLSSLLVDVDKDQMSAKLWANHMNQVRDHFERVRDKVSIQLTQLAPVLSKEQVNEFFDNLEQKNQRDEDEFNDSSAAEHTEQRVEDLIDTLDDYLGSVSQAQEKLIEQYIQDTPTDKLAYIRYRRAIQGQAREVFAQHSGLSLTDQLFELFRNSEQYKSTKLRQGNATKVKLGAILLHDIHLSLSAKQLRYFKEEVADFRSELSELMVAGA